MIDPSPPSFPSSGMPPGEVHRSPACVGAIILARAGSKGVPGKNVREIGGRACIEWTIDAALASAAIGPVVVSTDDGDAIRIAHARAAAGEQRVGVIDRPTELATDQATIDSAARHAAAHHPSLHTCSAFVILYANVPVRPPGLIDRAVARLIETNADSVQSYAPVGKHHPWWTARVDRGSGAVRPWEGDVLNHGVYRRQDLPPAHMPDGGVLVVRRAALMLALDGVPDGPHAFFGVERRGVLTEPGEVVDIDSEIDALVADAVLKERAHAHRYS